MIKLVRRVVQWWNTDLLDTYNTLNAQNNWEVSDV